MKPEINALDVLLFAEAWLMLATARCILLLVPFRKIAPVLGSQVTGEVPSGSALVAGSRQHQVGIAILRASKRSPWRTKCFEQALAATLMLKARKQSSIVFFGVYKSDNGDRKLNAHAWLKSGGMIVTGGRNLHLYTVLASFKS